MGNIGSHNGHAIQKQPSEQQWVHSFPRTPHLYQQHRVLPERDARQKLRHTNNGDILQSGGTLSGRHHQRHLSLEYNEFEDISPQSQVQNASIKTYLSNPRNALHKGPRFNQNGISAHYKDNIKKYGSEPDLRNLQTDDGRDKIRTKKKYKAPSPPKLVTVDKSEWEDCTELGDGQLARKTRLFKTRAETKKNYSSPVNKHKSLDSSKTDEIVQHRDSRRNLDIRSNRLSLPEIKMTENFHQELKEVTKRLWNTRTSLDNNTTEDNKLKTLDHNVNKKDNIRRLQQIHDINAEFSQSPSDVRGDGSGKESSSPEQNSPTLLRTSNLNKNQPKTFYFGMDENMQDEVTNNDIVDHFASNLHSMTLIPKINSSESDLSSEIETEEQNTRNGIDLKLRPILPKKQLEIPRFSPVAAWRLLSIDTNPVASTIASDDIPVFIEDRIEKFARPPPPTMQIGPRSNDKSGDSGISGDAGPAVYDDTPEVTVNPRNNLNGISWTPQQDLGDDSSIEEGLNNIDSDYKLTLSSKFSNKPHVFSLSLPRDNHLSSYVIDKNSQGSSLQKLKRSVSGVLGTLGNKKDLILSNLSQDQSENWFLSKSAPNSLNNGFNSLEVKPSKNSENTKDQLLGNSKSNGTSGRLMYLPQFETNNFNHTKLESKRIEMRERSKSADRSGTRNKLSVVSKSYEHINGEIRSSSEPEDLQDPKVSEDKNWKTNKKTKRFTFQSTVRQIERKRLAERLSREAEKKEKQRLRELEAMQKVEEEFQKKRAREKATIRQQLRLFSMDDTWTNTNLNNETKEDIRPEPDGAVSSSTTSSPSLPSVHKTESKKVFQKNKKMSSNNRRRPSSESSEDTRIKTQVTQVLSEYRHPQREYKEYTGGSRFLTDFDNSLKCTTVHPQVTCKMPKAKGQGSKISCNNYRKNFAHGVKSTKSIGESTYSEDSQSRNNSPRMYHNKYAPMTRF